MGTKTARFSIIFITALALLACGAESDRTDTMTTDPMPTGAQTPTTAEINSPTEDGSNTSPAMSDAGDNDDESNTSPAMADADDNDSQIQDTDNEMNDTDTGGQPDQTENENELPGETDLGDPNEETEATNLASCAEFAADHFYRQTAERFGDYEMRSMCDFKGSPILVVNTAARCGFTPQYTGLVELDEDYQERGLVILGFLSNDFGNQGGSDEEVERCNRDFRITFEQFSTVGVTPNSQDGQHPVFEWLTSQPGLEGPIQWNFNKFLIDRSGLLIDRWGSSTQPNGQEMRAAIESALSEAGAGN